MSTTDRVRFHATSTGTGNFVVASAVTGYLTPAGAGMLNGTAVTYIAQNPSDVTQWEYGFSTYTVSGTLIARASLRSSDGVATACNFHVAPVVAIGIIADNVPFLTAGMFGAIGDGVTDDTAELQAAINFAVPNGLELILGLGGNDANYLISSALTIPLGTGWKIRGLSRAGVFITQNTNNTQIFIFSTSLTHSWKISDLTLSWTNAQSSSNTNSCGFWFTGNNNTYFNFQIERIIFNNGFRGISTNVATSPTVWGCKIRDCIHNGNMTGSFFTNLAAIPAGQPNIGLDGIYVRADSIVSTEPVIRMNASDGFNMNNIEVNLAANGPPILQLENSHGSVGTVRVEGGTYTGSAYVFYISDSNISFEHLNVSSLTISSPGAYTRILYMVSAAQVAVTNSSMDAITVSSGQLYLVECSAFPGYSVRFNNAPLGLTSTSGMFLTYVAGTDSCEGVSVASWEQRRMTANNGDADSNWTIGVTAGNIIRYLSTLTADRTITLTDYENGADTNLYDGVVVQVVRNAAAPGAFNLNVLTAAGDFIGTLAGTNGTMSFMWSRFAWQMIDYETWGQVAATAKTTSTTLTTAELFTGIITVNPGGPNVPSALQLPTASAMDTALQASVVGTSSEFSLINISTAVAETASITTNSGWTLVGDMDVLANSIATAKSAGLFRARKTGTGAWTLYRIS